MAGITQLLSLLNPVGAVIQAIIKTYTTIQFFIQRINQILDLVESIVNSIAAIAAGAIGAAANFVERTMARTIPVILDFLARFIGLGDVGGQVQTTIRNLQAQRGPDAGSGGGVDPQPGAQPGEPGAGRGSQRATPQQRLHNGLREGDAGRQPTVGQSHRARPDPAGAAPVDLLRHNMQRPGRGRRGDRWASSAPSTRPAAESQPSS